MVNENFTTYTEIDPDSKITKDSNTVTFTDIDPRTTCAYVYKDKGVGHFSGDFEHLLETNVSWLQGDATAGADPFLWALSNGIGSYQDLKSANVEGIYLAMWGSGGVGTDEVFQLYELHNSTSYVDTSPDTDLSTTYYHKVKRDESIGANGTLYAYIYDDAARTNLVDTLSLALHSKEDYQYIYSFVTMDNLTIARTTTGYVENLDLQEEKKTRGNAISKILALYK